MCWNTDAQNTEADQCMSYQTYSCTKCGSQSNVSEMYNYEWYCKACFKEAHRDAAKELECITERRYCGPELYKFAVEKYRTEFDRVLTSTRRNQNELLEEACQRVGSRIGRGQVSCDLATAEWARSIFRQRMEDAIKECFENLRE